MMDLDFSAVLPDDPSRYGGSQFIRIALALLLFVMVARSCVHLFASDGGAQRIGGVDTSVEGGNNIIAMFHQWGAIQLFLAVLLVVLYVRYPGFTAMILLTVALDPVMRSEYLEVHEGKFDYFNLPTTRSFACCDCRSCELSTLVLLQ